jgi:hypothetical protein
MKNSTLFLTLMLAFCASARLNAANFSSFISGNWDSPSTWTLTSGTDTDGLPDSDDDVIIASGMTVFVNIAGANVNKLTINGTLTKQSTGKSTVSAGQLINSGNVAVQSGVLELSNGTIATGSSGSFVTNVVDGLIFSGSGFNLTGPSITGTGSVIISSVVTLSNDLIIPLKVGVSGTFKGNVNAVIAGDLEIQPAAIFAITGSVSVTNLILSGGTFDPDGNTTVTNNFNWTKGNIGSAANLALPTTSTASSISVAGLTNITTGEDVYLVKKTLNTNGGGSMTPSFITSIIIRENGIFNIKGTFTASTDFPARIDLFDNSSKVNFIGDFIKEGSNSFAIDNGSSFFTQSMTITGSIIVNNGSFQSKVSSTHSGSFVSNVTEGVQFLKGICSLTGPSITGTGSLLIGNGTTQSAIITMTSDLIIPTRLAHGKLTGTFNTNIPLGNLSVEGSAVFDPIGTVTIGGNLTNTGQFIPKRAVNIQGNLTSNNLFGPSSNEVGTANFKITVGGTTTLSGGVAKVDILANGGGTIGEVTFYYGSSITIPVAKTLTINGNFYGAGIIISTGIVTTAGLGIITSGGNGVYTIGSGSRIENNGEIVIPSGALRLYNYSENGKITIATGANLHIYNRTSYRNALLTNNGTITGVSFAIEFAAGQTITAHTLAGNGAITELEYAGKAGVGTLDITGTQVIGILTVWNGTLNLNSSLSIPNVNVHSGNISGTGNLTISGALIQSSGTINPTGNLTIGTSLTQTGGTISNGGNVSVAGNFTGQGGTISNGGNLSMNGAFTQYSGSIASAGTVTIIGDMTQFGGSFKPNNVILNNFLFVSNGTFAPTGTTTITNAVIITGGTVAPIGTTNLNSTLSISTGTFSPMGTTTIAGAVTLTSGFFKPKTVANLNSTLNWSGGTIGDATNLTIPNISIAGLATLSGNTKEIAKCNVVLNGGGNWTAGNINFQGDVLIEVPVSKTWVVNASGNLLINDFVGGSSFDIKGSFEKQGTGDVEINVPLHSTGTITATSGTLILINPLSTGLFVNNSDVKFYGYDSELGAYSGNGTVSNYGDLVINTVGGLTYNQSTFTNNGRLNGNPLNLNGTTQQTILGYGEIKTLNLNNASGLVWPDGHNVENLNMLAGEIQLSSSGSLTVTNLTGANPSRYIHTNSSGNLIQNVGTTSVLFPIGKSNYTPITISQATGSDAYQVRVSDDINPTNALQGTAYVKKEWNISRLPSNTTPATIKAEWNTPTDEGIGFTSTAARMLHFDENVSSWEALPASGTTVTCVSMCVA